MTDRTSLLRRGFLGHASEHGGGPDVRRGEHLLSLADQVQPARQVRSIQFQPRPPHPGMRPERLEHVMEYLKDRVPRACLQPSGSPVNATAMLAHHLLAAALRKLEADAKVWLFGSNAESRRRGRDLDLAVEGVAPARFFRFVGDLMLSISQPLDVVALDTPSKLGSLIRREGITIYACALSEKRGELHVSRRGRELLRSRPGEDGKRRMGMALGATHFATPVLLPRCDLRELRTIR